MKCTLLLDVLTSAPYNLEFGDSIFAKVAATNFYGESEFSVQGNGGIVLLVPDAPINLLDNTAVTTAYVIGVTWEDGSSTGGSPILDYKITYDQSTGIWATLQEGITGLQYQTDDEDYQTNVVLATGATY